MRNKTFQIIPLLLIFSLSLPILSSTFVDLIGYEFPIGIVSTLFAIILLFSTKYNISKNAVYPIILCLLILLIGVLPFLLASDISNFKSLAYYTLLISFFLPGYLVPLVCTKFGISFEKIVLYVSIVISIYGIYTFAGQYYDFPLFLDFLRSQNSDGTLIRYTGWFRFYRAYSIYFEPSYLAIPAVFSLSIFMNMNPKDVPTLRYIFLFLSLICAVLTFSRAVWAVYLIFLLFAIYFSTFKKVPSLSFNFIMLASLLFVTFVMPLSQTESYDISTNIRLSTNESALKSIYENFPLGTGTRVLAGDAVYFEYNTSNYSSHIHSSFIASMYWIGLPGLVFCLIPTTSLSLFGIKKVNSKQKKVLAFYSFATFALISFFGDLIHLSDYWFFYGIIVSYVKQGLCTN